MIVKSFIFAGLLSSIAQVIKDKTTLSSGHITSLFVVIGAFLGFLGIYDKLIEIFGGGALVVISSFGNTLYKTSVEKGILNMLSGVSVGITATILMSFIITIIFRVKD